MSDFVNFTSLPDHEGAGFVVFEQRMAAAQSQGFTVAIVAGIAVLVLALAIYLGVAPDDTDITKDMNMSNLTRAPAQTTAAPAPASDTPAAAPAPAGSDTAA